MILNITFEMISKLRPHAHCTGDWVGPGAGTPTGIWSPDFSARSEPQYKLSYTGPPQMVYLTTNFTQKYRYSDTPGDRHKNDHITVIFVGC